jgi:glutathione S-transferase
MHRHLDEFERQLASESGTWILGKQFTLADVSWCVIFERLRQAESLELFVTPNNRPACHAWWLACIARPSYQQAITAHEHPIVLHGSHRLHALKETEPAVAALYAEQIGRPMNEG